MISRQHPPSRTGMIPGGVLLAIALFLLFCGCLQVEPEELPPAALPEPVAATESPTPQPTADSIPRVSPPVSITSPRLTSLFRTDDFPPEVITAVTDFTGGRTSDTINSYLRWESVRSRTNRQEAARIQEQISRIDYAVYNTTLRENVSVYIGLSPEQARKARNESVFSENSYLVASYDPSVIYTRLAGTGRDNNGYFTMCAIDLPRGSYHLFINASEREFLLPRGGIWDVAGEDSYRELTFTAESIPRYDDIIMTDVRIIHTREHP